MIGLLSEPCSGGPLGVLHHRFTSEGLEEQFEHTSMQLVVSLICELSLLDDYMLEGPLQVFRMADPTVTDDERSSIAEDFWHCRCCKTSYLAVKLQVHDQNLGTPTTPTSTSPTATTITTTPTRWRWCPNFGCLCRSCLQILPRWFVASSFWMRCGSSSRSSG